MVVVADVQAEIQDSRRADTIKADDMLRSNNTQQVDVLLI